MSEGAWIFLSHSHKDCDQVRDLRNELEALQHHPLMFFLKCLSDDSEVDGLIRREIEARSWFILCDSTNSRASTWVQAERLIIAGLPTHTSATVDLADPIAVQLKSISGLVKRATVFLSYVHEDEAAAKAISASLRRDDFGVFSDLQLTPGMSWREEIESALDDAATRGSVLVLLSRSSGTSRYQLHEIAYALERASHGRPAHVVPIFIDAPFLIEMPPGLHEQLLRIQGIDLSTGDFELKMTQLKQRLRNFEW